jgi:predicted Ser/Thr protein kinase
MKSKLYDSQSLQGKFTPAEEVSLKELRHKIATESEGSIAYEGRFGASPREIKGILHRASENPNYQSLTPMAIFEELERLVKDRTIYEFLQLEPKGEYYRPDQFIKVIQNEFANIFEREVTFSMEMVEEGQYEALLARYVDHVVAKVKKEKIYNKATGNYEEPSERIMGDIEKILKIPSAVDKHREGMLGRIAAYKLDHPNETIVVAKVFHDYLKTIQEHYYNERKKKVESNFKAMLMLDTPDDRNLTSEERELAKITYTQLEKRYGYDPMAARDCVRFLIKHKSLATKTS